MGANRGNSSFLLPQLLVISLPALPPSCQMSLSTLITPTQLHKYNTDINSQADCCNTPMLTVGTPLLCKCNMRTQATVLNLLCQRFKHLTTPVGCCIIGILKGPIHKEQQWCIALLLQLINGSSNNG